jgi:magnesium transporter
VHTTVFSAAIHGFDWIHYLEPEDSELSGLSESLNINPLYIQDVMQAEHLPKVEPVEEDKGFFLIARVLDPRLGNKDFNSIPDATRKLAVFYRPGQVISIQRAPFPWLEDLIRKCKSAPEQMTDKKLVCKLLKYSFKSFEPLLQKLAFDLDFFESKLFENERFPPFAKSLYSLKTKASILKRFFAISAPLVEFLRENMHPEPYAQDAIDMYNRIYTLVEDASERSAGLINLNLSINSQRSNEVMRFLTIYSAFFMPLTFIVGVYGMNFSHMPEVVWEWGYVFCWLLMIFLSVLHFLWFRNKKWL